MSDEEDRVIDIHLESSGAQSALWLLKSEIDIARLQFERIRNEDAKGEVLIDTLRKTSGEVEGLFNFEDIEKMQKQMKEHQDKVKALHTQLNKNNRALFADIHFLIITLSHIDPLIQMIEKHLPANQDIKDIRKKYQQSLRDYTDFRNHLEHIDERLERGVGDLGNLTSKREFTFDNKTFDVSNAREKELNAIFNEIVAALEKVSKYKEIIAKQRQLKPL